MNPLATRPAQQPAAHGHRPPLVCKVLSYGPGVREFLSGSRISAQVVAVFQRALYLRDIGGSMICIAHEGVHDAPVTIRAAIPRQFDLNKFRLTVGMPADLAIEDELNIGGRVVLVMSDAVEWRPIEVVATATAEQVLNGLKLVSSELGKHAPAIGLAPLVLQVESFVDEKKPRPTPDAGLLRTAIPAVEKLVRSVRLRDSVGIDAAVKRLLGLGPGLTPSGDDFLCGFMVAGIITMKALGPDSSRSCDFDGGMSDVAESISLHAATMTTEISASFLDFATRGITSSAVHRFVERLLDADDEQEPVSAARVLTEIGHSSGWDFLLGTLLGMHLCLALQKDGQTVEDLDLPGHRTRP